MHVRTMILVHSVWYNSPDLYPEVEIFLVAEKKNEEKKGVVYKLFFALRCVCQKRHGMCSSGGLL